MSKEAPRVPEFGAYLKAKRGERSLESVANQIRAVGVARVNSALFRYEAGRVPPVDVLRGLSFALRVPFEDLVDRVLFELAITPVEWAEPVVHGESNLPADALMVAKAYASCDETHVKAATLALLRVPTGRATGSAVPTEVAPEANRFRKRERTVAGKRGARRRPSK